MARPGLGGELHALGIIDTINLPQIPANISFCILAKLRFRKSEEGFKKIQFSIIDMDGRPLQATLPAQTIDVRVPNGSSSASAAIVAQINNLTIPKAGEYELGVTVNDRLEMSAPIFVRLIVLPPPAQQQQLGQR